MIDVEAYAVETMLAFASETGAYCALLNVL